MWFKKRLRFLVKTLTYKTLSVLITILAVWIMTGSPMIGLTLGLIEITVKLLVYYIHEEIWGKIDFGVPRCRKKKKKKKKKKKRTLTKKS